MKIEENDGNEKVHDSITLEFLFDMMERMVFVRNGLNE